MIFESHASRELPKSPEGIKGFFPSTLPYPFDCRMLCGRSTSTTSTSHRFLASVKNCKCPVWITLKLSSIIPTRTLLSLSDHPQFFGQGFYVKKNALDAFRGFG